MSNPELDALKEKADKLGINYHPRTGIAKLEMKIKQELAARATLAEQAMSSNDFVAEEEELAIPSDPIIHAPTKAQIFAQRKKEASKLIRIRVTCMNPNKKDWPGEIISVGSAKLGTFKKFVPFNNAAGYHVPYIIYTTMRDRKCSIFQTIPGPGKEKIRKAKQTNEFSIEILPPLTGEELKDLAQRQALAGSVD